VTDVAQLREGSEQRAAARSRGPEMARVTDLTVEADPPVRVRLYEPSLEVPALVVYAHGGGWTIGSLATHDGTCRRLASLTGLAVLATEQRLAPENPWPAGLDDVLAVYRWARDGAPTRLGTTMVGVAGDSSGGNLAALVCLRLRDAGEAQPAAQVLVYPNTDLTMSQPSIVENATGWGLESDGVRWFNEQWVPDPARRADPRVSPLLEADLGGLAPAVVVTAEHDPLRDEGNAYAAKLAAAGVPVTHHVEAGLEHGFLGPANASAHTDAAFHRLAADIRLVMGKAH
jgi:acetyl esterase